MRRTAALALSVLLLVAVHVATAAETIKVAIPDRGSWDTAYTELGRQKGFFQEQDLEVQIVHVADRAALEGMVTSGEADVAVAAIFPDVIAARLKGAPIKIISPEATGAPDIFWFARAGGPIRHMGDLHGQPVGFEAPGSLSHFVLLSLLKESGVDDARLMPTGPADNGIPMVLGAQLFASWGGPAAAAKDLLANEVTLIGRGDDSPLLQNETLRVNIASAKFLKDHRSSVLGFLKAYKKSIDWAYSSQAAIEAYAKLSDQSLEFAKYIVQNFASKATNQLDEIKGEDHLLAEALALGRIPTALSREEIRAAYDLVLKDGS